MTRLLQLGVYVLPLGGANLYVNVSVVLTGENFHPDLLKRGSEMFNSKTSLIETQVCSSESYFLILNDLINTNVSHFR